MTDHRHSPAFGSPSPGSEGQNDERLDRQQDRAVFQQRLTDTDALPQIAALQEELAATAARAAALEARVEQLGHAEARAAAEEQRALAAEARAAELGDDAHRWWLQARALEAERDALHQSWSWRITAPVRWMGRLALLDASAIRRGAGRLASAGAHLFRRLLVGLMRIVLGKPALSERLNRMLLRYPSLHRRLLGIARQGGAIPGAPTNPLFQEQPTPSDLNRLTPRARRIHQELIVAIQDRHKSDG